MHDNFEIRAEGQAPAEVVETLASTAAAAMLEAPTQAHRVQLRKSHRPAKKSSMAQMEAAETEQVAQDELDAEAVRGADSVRMYLNEIGKVALLNAEEEVELSKRIETGVFAETILNYREGDDEEREAIRRSVLKGVTVRLKAEAAQARKADGQKKPKAAKERSEAEQKATLERETQAAAETEASMVSIERLAKDKKFTSRELRALIADGKRAKEHLQKANLRLVVSIAKRHMDEGMPFLDVIQEGNLGLIRAVEKFDYTKGFKFSTYATWWIRQAISRAMGDQSRTIRLPVHMVEVVNKLGRIERELRQSLGREPTREELAKEMDIDDLGKIDELQGYRRDVMSLDQSIGEDDNDGTLGDLIADADAPDAFEAVAQAQLSDKLARVLETFDMREQTIIRMRYGIGYPAPMTLDEIGREFGVSRERIRQLEHIAMKKLQQPEHKRVLKDYLD